MFTLQKIHHYFIDTLAATILLSYVISKVAIFGMLLSRKMGLGFTNTRGCQIYRSVDCHLESISVVGRNQ